MPELSDNQQKSEIERLIDLDHMGVGGMALEITPNDSERQALAKRFGFLDLPVFSARVTIDRQLGEQIVVEGRLRGRVVQACVLSLEPVVQLLDDGLEAENAGLNNPATQPAFHDDLFAKLAIYRHPG